MVAGWPRPATASVGIAISDEARSRVEDLLHDAEAALRRARARGGADDEHVFDPVTDIEPAAVGDPVLRWRPAGTGTSRLRRLARAAGLVLPSRF